MVKIPIIFGFIASTMPFILDAAEGFSSPIHVFTPSVHARCINASNDEVTVSLRRVLIQKTGGIFVEDKRAGVAVVATLNAKGADSSKTPSVTQVTIKDEHPGQVSLALEYPIASELALKQGNALTQNLQLSLYLAKTRDKTTFGNIIDVASDALQKLPIPSNPYTQGVDKFLEFANTSIEKEIKDTGADLFASMTMQFADRDEDVTSCLADGNQATGAMAVIRSTGDKKAKLLPITDLNAKYCFRYSTSETYELQYAAKSNIDCGAISEGQWAEVPNDYVMLLVSAAPTIKPVSPDLKDRARPGPPERLFELLESKKLCDAMKVPASFCGVQ
jgi:hypothetical protein